MKKILTTISLLAVALLCQLSAQSIWDKSHLESVRQNTGQPYYAAAYQQLLSEAESVLDKQPLSVMLKKDPPASGNMHDYMSIGRYTWPDPSKPDGLPYIHRDGESNPELKLYDREPLGETASRVITLSLAYYFSGDERYAAKATELIRVWFFNKDTYMNPHLRYAQVVKGVNNNLGRSHGLIDSYSFIDMLEAVQLLESSKSFTAKDSKKLKKWFSDFLTWFTTDPAGIEEGNARNNHSIAYDSQVISFALYCGNLDLAKQYINAFMERRIYPQVMPDGSQPAELQRTLAFHYSWYNLTHMVDISLMAKNLGIDLMSQKSADGRCISAAIDFLFPYVGQQAKPWEWKQISGMELAKQNYYKDLYRVYALLDGQRADYLQMYQDNRVLDLTDRFNLIYFEPTATDHAMAWSSMQLRTAIDDARQARQLKENLSDRRVEPRTVKKDGTLSMVSHYDWCCGFFPGSLWQIYEYTHDNYWREHAVSNTWLIEDLKYHGGTHDLGFMAGCSFGNGYRLTGEKSMRDVLIKASRTLITRFNPTIGCIRSWDHNRDKWQYPVIIDNMMNLEMLFTATQLTGDSTFWKIALSHADVTLQNHFRPDASSYHVVDYDQQTGQARLHQTHQGYSDDSFWSRGQGWALYGYTMCYRFTREQRYLDQAKRVANFLMTLPNMPADGIPYWDMKDPAIVSATTGNDNPDVPRDASAAALMASALYELATFVPEMHDAYRATADHILDSLDAAYHPALGEAHGFLLLHSTGHKPANSEVDVPLSYADYYYLEAQLRRARLK